MKTHATCSSVVSTFEQPDNEHCDEVQELKITITHEGAGAFMILETKRWAVHAPDEIQTIAQRAWKRCHKLIDEDRG